MKRKGLPLFLLCLCTGLIVFGQEGRRTELPLVEVLDSIELSVQQFSAISFDTLLNEGMSDLDAGEMINGNSTVFVKDYGPGGTSVMSYRGGTAYHTKVYWEGVSIEDPMLGQLDLSLIQPGQNMSMRFYRGGNSLSLGTGGFGGILNIQQGSSKWKGISVAVGESYGSFSTHRHQSSVMVGNGKFKFESSTAYQESSNNYLYFDYINDQNYKPRENAAFSKWQWMPKLSYRVGSHEFFVSYWYARSDRQIPSAVGTNHGGAMQQDEWNRAMAGWEIKRSRWKFQLHSALLIDDLDYQNEGININSINQTQASRTVGTLDLRLSKKWAAETQLKYSHTKAISNNYFLEPVREEMEGFEAITYHSKHLLLSARLRYYQLSGESENLLPSFTARYLIEAGKSNLSVFANVGENVRYPTFNELFWQTSEALQLKEEHSVNSELGILLSKGTSDDIKHEIQLTTFYSYFDNLILWLPDNSGVWKPQNQRNAINYGLELEGNFSGKWKTWMMNMSGGYGYTKSLVNNVSDAGDERHQQIYTPEHKAHVSTRITKSGVFVGYRQMLTGKIYLTSDNLTYLPMSSPATLESGYRKNWKTTSVTFKAEVKNLWNESYQFVANMPMPLRHYCLTLLLNYN